MTRDAAEDFIALGLLEVGAVYAPVSPWPINGNRSPCGKAAYGLTERNYQEI